MLLLTSLGLLAGCGNYLNVQPQGEVIPKTDEEFASLIHNRLREIEGGGDEYVIGNMDVLVHLEGCADDLDANITTSSNLTFFAGEEINKRQTFYENCWETVRDCNIVIENMKGRDTDIAKGRLCFGRLCNERHHILQSPARILPALEQFLSRRTAGNS